MKDKSAPLSGLPLSARPGFSLEACFSRMHAVITRAHRNISPPLFRRLMGGISKDHARAIVATCHADIAAIVRTANQIQNVCSGMSDSADEKTRHRGKALGGICHRLITASREWSTAASEFEANIFGSDKSLVEACLRLLKLHDTLEKQLGVLSDW